MTPREFWWRHARWPLFAFIVLAALGTTTPLDTTIATTLFFDATTGAWRGTHSWWVNAFMHTGGRWAMRAVAASWLALWVVACCSDRLRSSCRASAFMSLGLIGSMLLVGALKSVTNVDCPWDLAPFGGQYPYVGLFADRPDGLRPGHCFPSAHASSGYALMAFYFLLLEQRGVRNTVNRRLRWASAGLLAGIVTGLSFGLAQQARGAHFLSHDVWSATLVWLWLLTLYVYGFRCSLRATSPATFRIENPPTACIPANDSNDVTC